MTIDEAKRLRELEAENSKLKRLVADLSLDIDVTACRGFTTCFAELPRGVSAAPLFKKMERLESLKKIMKSV
jgi:hypothetical protein